MHGASHYMGCYLSQLLIGEECEVKELHTVFPLVFYSFLVYIIYSLVVAKRFLFTSMWGRCGSVGHAAAPCITEFLFKT